MKKLINLIIVTLILALCFCTTAVADEVKVILVGDNNRLAGPRNLDELNEFVEDYERASRSSVIGGMGLYGPVLRAKAMVRAVDRSYSTVDIDIVEIYDAALLEELEISKTANDIMAATIEIADDCMGHRFVCPDDPAYPVAMLSHDDHPILVVSYDWDDDGLENLCLVAGSKATTGYEIPEKNDDQSADTDGDADGDTDGDADGDTDGESNMPVPTLRPRN